MRFSIQIHIKRYVQRFLHKINLFLTVKSLRGWFHDKRSTPRLALGLSYHSSFFYKCYTILYELLVRRNCLLHSRIHLAKSTRFLIPERFANSVSCVNGIRSLIHSNTGTTYIHCFVMLKAKTKNLMRYTRYVFFPLHSYLAKQNNSMTAAGYSIIPLRKKLM